MFDLYNNKCICLILYDVISHPDHIYLPSSKKPKKTYPNQFSLYSNMLQYMFLKEVIKYLPIVFSLKLNQPFYQFGTW